MRSSPSSEIAAADAGDRARRREVEFDDPGVREVRAQDDAFELTIMADIDGVFRSPVTLSPASTRGETASSPSKRPAQASATARKMPS